MKKIRIPADEQETVITFNRQDKQAVIYTSDATMATKMDKKYPRDKEFLSKGRLTGVEYIVPKSSVVIKSKSEKPKISDEEKQKLLNRLRK